MIGRMKPKVQTVRATRIPELRSKRKPRSVLVSLNQEKRVEVKETRLKIPCCLPANG